MQSRALQTESIIASGIVAAHRCITFTGAQAAAQGVKVLGVAHFAGVAGHAIAVDVIGSTVVEAGAAIADGDSLITDNQGRAIPAAGAAGEVIFADARQAAATAGQKIEVLLRR